MRRGTAGQPGRGRREVPPNERLAMRPRRTSYDAHTMPVHQIKNVEANLFFGDILPGKAERVGPFTVRAWGNLMEFGRK